jgi:hypothetical protein
MIVENNWLTTNIKDRITNKSLDFSVVITPYPFEKKSFASASEATALKIAALGKPIYIAFSGGADSEYVVRLFKKLNIPFTALTVKTPGNQYELFYADLLYDSNPDIQKIYIDFDSKSYLKKYLQTIKITKVNAIHSIPLIECARYAKNNGGIVISGDYLGDCGYNKTTGIMLAGFSEWDFYTDIFVDENVLVPFFHYDLSIVESMVSLFDKSKTEVFKSNLYKTVVRPKFKYHLGNNFGNVIEKINAKIKNSPKSQVIFPKKQFLELIEKS